MACGNTDSPVSSQPVFSVVVTAAGVGGRMGGCKKPYAEICGRPILYHCIDRLRKAAGCAEIIPVLHAEEYGHGQVAARLAAEFGITRVVCGGATRQESVLAGLEAVREDLDLVLIHDAVRPLVSPDVVQRVAGTALRFGAAIAAVRATDTVKEVNESGRIVATPVRDRLWRARTPQGFRKDVILRAHRAARDDGVRGTDDSEFVERLGLDVYVVEDTYENLKITVAEDLVLAEALLRWQEAGEFERPDQDCSGL